MRSPSSAGLLAAVMLSALMLLATSCAKHAGCLSSNDCPDRSLMCEKEAGTCQDKLAKGECVEKPAACTAEVDPVCGCDGQTYANDCNRRLAGATLDRKGACGPSS